ncbi:MAG: PAS domain S-box protein [Chloroflexota bacterium]|nr:PAS domain S-box protein [Chloroflexota bacterium]
MHTLYSSLASIQANETEEEINRGIIELLENNPQPFLAVALSGQILFLNQEAAHLFHLNRKTTLGQNLWAVFPSLVDSAFYSIYQQALENQAPQQGEEFFTALSSWFEVKICPTEKGVAIYFQNITQQKEAEERARRLATELEIVQQKLSEEIFDRTLLKARFKVVEKKYQTLFKYYPLGITVTNEAGQIIEANPAAEKILGLSINIPLQRILDERKWHIIRRDGTPMPLEEFADVRALSRRETVPEVIMGIVKESAVSESQEPNQTTWLSVTAAPLPIDGYGVVIAYRDVTDQVVSQQTLQKSEKRYRTLVENFPNGAVFLFDLEGRCLSAEGTALAESAYLKQQLLGKTVREAYPSKTGEQMESLYRRTLAGEKLTTEMNFADRIYQTYLTPISDADGKIFAGMIMTHDITERKALENHLYRQNKYLSALYETTLQLVNHLEIEDVLKRIVSTAATMLESNHCSIMLLNTAKSAMVLRASFGVKKAAVGTEFRRGEGLAGQVWEAGQALNLHHYHEQIRVKPTYITPENLPAYAAVGIPLRNKDGLVGVLVLTYHDPSRSFALEEMEILERLAQLVALALENAQLYTAVQQELTERKRAEVALRQSEKRREVLVEVLRESEELYRAFFEQSAIGVARINSQGYILKANPAYHRILGYDESSNETAEGLHFTEFSLPENTAQERERFKELQKITLRQQLFEFEPLCIRKDGRQICCHFSITPVRDKQGQLLYVILMVQDITARKEAETQLKASLTEKEVLLREIHHRVKNNLQIISSLLKMQGKLVQDSLVLAVLEECQQRVRSIALIHEKLYQSNNLAQIDLGAYLKSLSTQLFRTYRLGKGSLAQLKVNQPTFPIFLDIYQALPCGLILNELITNALKYAFPEEAGLSEEGEISINLEAFAGQESGGVQVILTVRDNGIGLPPAFDFASSKTLGLQLMQMFSLQLQGITEIESRPRQGTCFKLAFQIKNTN